MNLQLDHSWYVLYVMILLLSHRERKQQQQNHSRSRLFRGEVFEFMLSLFLSISFNRGLSMTLLESWAGGRAISPLVPIYLSSVKLCVCARVHTPLPDKPAI